MRSSFLHVWQHWSESRPPLFGGLVVLSELPKGESPVRVPVPCLNYVLEGTEHYEVNGKVTRVEAGQFLFVDAGATGRAILPRPGTTRGMCIYLPRAAPLRDHDPLASTFLFAASAHGFGRALEESCRVILLDRADAPAAADAIFRRSIAEFDLLASDMALRALRIEAAKPSTRRLLLQQVERARAYLHDHPHRPVPLEELAAMVGMSPFHLARTFRAVHGAPPAYYHRALRLRRADREVRHSGLPLVEIAERHGFSDASSFARAYRRLFGNNPADARHKGA